MDVVRLVLACDYGQNKHELGSQSRLRLEGAMRTFLSDAKVLFVFAAGRLSPEDARLCDLQKAYVEQEGFKAIVPERNHPNIWGTLGELRYLHSIIPELRKKYPHARIEVYTADYQRNRARALGQAKVGLKEVAFIAVNSKSQPPSFRAHVHQQLGYLEVFLPDIMVLWMKNIRRYALRKNIFKY